jgi:SAM-dependent methyltransferase
MTKRPGPWHALHYLPRPTEAILDVGCNAGETLKHASELGVKKLFGIDINPEAVKLAKQSLSHIPDHQLFQGSADHLPFETAAADAAICSEVLEHIPEDIRAKSLKEIHRVLKPNAPLILTVPASGAFAFLDPANVRLRFPRVFEVASKLAGGYGREIGYENQKHGIVWHHHFSISELKSLMGDGFNIELIRWRGCLLSPICNWLEFPFYRRRAYTHPLLKAIRAVDYWEMKQNLGSVLGYNVLIVARRV